MVNTLAGAQVFYSLSNEKVPLALCIIVLAIGYDILNFSNLCSRAWIISFLGYQCIHRYERYAWIVMFIFFSFLTGFGARYIDNIPMSKGKKEVVNVMSFGMTLFGSSISWSSAAADYATYFKEDTTKWKLFLYTFLGILRCLSKFINIGLTIGQMFVMWLGAALITATINNTTFTNAYNVAGIGGLMDASFQGRGSTVHGFGKFVQLGLVMSTIASVIPCFYSAALSIQNVGTWAVKIPRFAWNTIAFITVTIAAVTGRQHFAAILTNFLNCLSYWYSPFPNADSGFRHGPQLYCWSISFSVEVTGIT
jgi:purine-cytosine permease-like protein